MPRSANYHVGQSLFDCFYDDEDGSVSSELWIVRTIRGGRVYAVQKNKFTWGKVSKKHGDYGWLEPVPDWLRQSTAVGRPFLNLHTTRRQAVNAELSRFTQGRGRASEYALQAIRKLRAYRARIKKEC